MAATDLKDAQWVLQLAVKRDLERFWAMLGPVKPEAARAALMEFVPALTDKYGQMAAAVAADWYDRLRRDAGAAGRFAARPAETVPVGAVEARVGLLAGHLWSDSPSGIVAPLAAFAAKFAVAPSWNTVKENADRDPKARGWFRATRPGACKFCRALADRGAVYVKRTAEVAAHTNCNCAVLPSWDPTAPEADVRQYVMSTKTAGMSPAAREKHRARVRGWLAAMPD